MRIGWMAAVAMVLAMTIGCAGVPYGYTPDQWDLAKQQNPRVVEVINWTNRTSKGPEIRRVIVDYYLSQNTQASRGMVLWAADDTMSVIAESCKTYNLGIKKMALIAMDCADKRAISTNNETEHIAVQAAIRKISEM